MVVGNGLVANRFKEMYSTNNNFIIFASGVSNSKCTNTEDFNREIELLKKTIEINSSKIIIYFSTCSIYDKEEESSMYVLHKKEIEKYIINNCRSWYIFRVPNVLGNTTNPNTFFNFFYNAIKIGTIFTLWQNASRNLIDIDDVFVTVDYIIKNKLFQNTIINLANPINTSVLEIVKTIENLLKKKGNYMLIDKGNSYPIDVTIVQPIYTTLKLTFPPQYLSLLLNKYYKEENDI